MSPHCLITGTTCGIGLHLAELALSRGAVVVSIGRSGLSSPHQFFERDLDVTDDDALSEFIGALPISCLDIIINNAGVFPDPDIGLSDLAIRDLLRAFDVNAAAPLRVVTVATGDRTSSIWPIHRYLCWRYELIDLCRRCNE